MEDSRIEKLITSLKCGVCGQHYETDNISILSHRQAVWYLRALCAACHTRFLVAVVIEDGRMPQVITDLTETELDKFEVAGVLTADDVLDMHNFLKDFSGDISLCFGQELNKT